MSFVLDALKKADRERDDSQDHKQAVNDIDFLNSDIFSANEPANTKAKYFFFIAFIMLLLSAWIYLTPIVNKPVTAKLVENDKAEKITVDMPVVSSRLEPTVSKRLEEAAVETPQPEVTVTQPSYNITGHIYLSDSHPANKIFIDEISYRIGSQLPDNYKIINITAQKLVIEKYGKYFEIKF